VTYKLTQGHWQSYHSIGHIWFPICLLYCKYVSILHRFQDIITYFPKLKDVMWPWPSPLKGQFVIPVLKHHMANQYTKFQVSSYNRSGDILGWKKIKMGHVSITRPFSGSICHLCARTSYDSAVYQIWNLYVHSLRRYERWRKMQKLESLKVIGNIAIQ